MIAIAIMTAATLIAMIARDTILRLSDAKAEAAKVVNGDALTSQMSALKARIEKLEMERIRK